MEHISDWEGLVGLVSDMETQQHGEMAWMAE